MVVLLLEMTLGALIVLAAQLIRAALLAALLCSLCHCWWLGSMVLFSIVSVDEAPFRLTIGLGKCHVGVIGWVLIKLPDRNRLCGLPDSGVVMEGPF